jgi:hypothetical protein
MRYLLLARKVQADPSAYPEFMNFLASEVVTYKERRDEAVRFMRTDAGRELWRFHVDERRPAMQELRRSQRPWNMMYVRRTVSQRMTGKFGRDMASAFQKAYSIIKDYHAANLCGLKLESALRCIEADPRELYEFVAAANAGRKPPVSYFLNWLSPSYVSELALFYWSHK